MCRAIYGFIIDSQSRALGVGIGPLGYPAANYSQARQAEGGLQGHSKLNLIYSSVWQLVSILGQVNSILHDIWL